MEKTDPFPKIKDGINSLFDTFQAQELGNRLSQFALLALREMVLERISSDLKGIPISPSDVLKGNPMLKPKTPKKT